MADKDEERWEEECRVAREVEVALRIAAEVPMLARTIQQMASMMLTEED